MAKAKQRKHTAHEKAKKEGKYANKGGGAAGAKARKNPGKTYKCRKFYIITSLLLLNVWNIDIVASF